MDVNTPTHMRAPGVATGLFALECAMDELAVALDMDPLELRLANYAERNEEDDLPWSSKELRACYRMGAERFGWSRRAPAPRSMRAGAWLVGYGMATALYPAYRSEASASATVFADGTAIVRSAASDMGPGTYTAMTQVAADVLELPLDRVRFELGDTALPKAPVHGGSITMASVGTAVQAACEAIRAKLGAANGRSYAEALREHGLEPAGPAVGNFLFAQVGEDSRPFFERLLREGVIVRPTHGFGAPGAIRVTVGTEDEHRFLAEALDRVGPLARTG